MYRRQGQYEKAIKYYKEALEIKSDLIRENHLNIGIAIILSNIGLAYRKLNKLEESIAYYKQALKVKKLACGEYSPLLCCTYENLARVYYMQKMFEHAIACYQRTIDIYKGQKLENKARLQETLYEVALCFKQVYNFEESIANFSECIHIRENLYGANDILTLEAKQHLGQIYILVKNYESAIQLYE